MRANGNAVAPKHEFINLLLRRGKYLEKKMRGTREVSEPSTGSLDSLLHLKMDYYNSWLRDDLETLKRDIEIALVIYDIRMHLLPTAVENILEKTQALAEYIVRDDIQISYGKPVVSYSDNYTGYRRE